MKIANQSLRLGLVAFVIPMVFMYQPALLMQGAWYEIVLSLGFAAFGIYLVGICLEGWYNGHLSWLPRTLFLIASVCLLFPQLWIHLVGAVLGITTLLVCRKSPFSSNKTSVVKKMSN